MNNSYTTMPSKSEYIDDILRANKGKKIELFLSFYNSTEWKNQTFKGIVENAGKDHLILSDPTDGNWYIFPIIYIDYIKFEEQITHDHSFSPHI